MGPAGLGALEAELPDEAAAAVDDLSHGCVLQTTAASVCVVSRSRRGAWGASIEH